MDNSLKLRVMFGMVDNWTKPLKNILGGNKRLAQSLKNTRGELAELNRQQKAVASFREMRVGLRTTSTNLAAAEGNVKKLAKSLRTFGPPSQQMIADLDRARQAATKLRAEEKKQKIALSEMRAKLASSGIDTNRLAAHQRTLRTSIASANATLTTQTRRLDALAAAERRLDAARRRMQATQGTAAGMAVAGYAGQRIGMRALGGIGDTLGEAKTMSNELARTRALGLGDTAIADAEKYVRAMNTMGVSTTENMTLMRDSLSIFADEGHAKMVMPTLAKMKFANEALFGAEDANANEEKFMNMLKVIELRGGTKNEAVFKREANMVQKVLSATGGRVGGDEWRNFIQTGGVAAKQMRGDAFFYQMEPLIQEMGGHAVGTGLMSAYNNAYQGKTTVKAARKMVDLGLVDKKGVEYNKIGQVSHFKAGALKGSEVLKQSPLEWMEKYFLPALKAKGITDDGKIKDVIATVFTNRTAANLMTTMYTQRDQIRKNERLNAGAYDIDQAAMLGGAATHGREIDALSKLHDLKLQIGEVVTPLYNAALDKTRAAAERLMQVMKKHPEATKAVVKIIAALGVLLVAMGSLTIALAGLLGPFAVVRFGMTAIGVKGRMLGGVFRALGGGVRLLSSLFRSGLVRSMTMVGRTLMLLGRLALANPIIAVVMLLAMAAFYVWQNWDSLRPKFARLWNALLPGLSAAGNWIREKWTAILEWIKQKLEAIKAWFLTAGAGFVEIGQNLLGGLITGIKNGLGGVKDAITNVANSTVAWFKEKLGIHSPSVVFARLGGFVSEGAADGMNAGKRHVSAAALGLATAAMTSFGAPALSTAATRITPNAPIMRSAAPTERRAPGAVDAAARSSSGAAESVVINIYGDDPHAIAREVNAVLERRERERRLRVGSRLTD